MTDDGRKQGEGRGEEGPRPLVERREAFARRQAEKGRGVGDIGAGHDPYTGREPRGSGPPNRHGMPRLPVGQRAVPNWPVLDLGVHPEIAREAWRLEIAGLVERPCVLDWGALTALPQVDEQADFHCVTTWSRFDLRLGGVRFVDLMEHVGLRAEATHVFVTAYDEDPSSGEAYTTNLSLADAMAPDVLLVHSWDGAPLPKEHGGPCRMVTPRLYGWKGAKWIRRIDLRDYDERGFWERRGYSSTAYPWLDDRYSR